MVFLYSYEFLNTLNKNVDKLQYSWYNKLRKEYKMKNKKTLILKILILLTAIVTGLGLAARTQAAEVTDYTQQTSITKDGVPLTSD